MRLHYTECPNGNLKADWPLTKTEGVTVIKLVKENKYKLKPYEIIKGEKVCVRNLLIEYGEFPVVAKEEVKSTIAKIKELTTDEED